MGVYQPIALVLGPTNYPYLARELGMHVDSIRNALEGRKGITLERANQLAHAAGVSIDVLQRHIKRTKVQRLKAKAGAAA